MLRALPSPSQRLCLNGSSGQEVIISSGLETVEALAFDPLSQLLYWVDAGLKKIEVRASRGVLSGGLLGRVEPAPPSSLNGLGAPEEKEGGDGAGLRLFV